MRYQATFNRRNNHSVIQDAPWPTVLLVVFPACPKASRTRLARRTASASISLCSLPAHQSRTLPIRRFGQTRDRTYRLPEYTDEVWHGYVPDRGPGTIMASVSHGPYEPTAGHRFNPNKLLLDPYASRSSASCSGIPRCSVIGWRTGDDLTFDERDSAPFMPKSRGRRP